MTTDRVPFHVSAFAQLAAAEANHWWFRSRNRVLLWAIAANIKEFWAFLEIGCGTGFVLAGVRSAYPNAQLFGAEYFEEGLRFAQERIPSAVFRQLDATELAEVATYDVIGAFDVIEHIEQDEKVLTNLARALKPQGALVITVPQHRWMWSIVDEHACHVRRYIRAELVEKVKRAGLQVEYVTSFVSILLPLMWLSRLRARPGTNDPMREFRLSGWLNWALEVVMRVELSLLKMGVRFPVGGSLLLIAKKGEARS